MASTGDLEAQADILAQMQESMTGLSDTMGLLNEGTNSFTEAMSGLVDMMPDLEAGAANMADMTEGANKATEATTNMTSAMEKLTGQQKASNNAVSDGTKRLKKYTAAGAGLAIVGSIWKNMMGMIKSVGNLISGIVTTSTNLIKSVWSAYTSTWNALGAMAKDMYKGAGELRKAYEEIRTTFGDLSTGSGAAVVGMFKDVRSSGDFARNTGMGLYHTFGNMADQLKIFNEIAKDGGEIFRRSSEYWKAAGFEALMMNKAFNVGGKAMALMGEAAERAGESAKEATESYAKMAVGLKKKFGVELKSLGKNFQALQEDVGSFGHLSRKELVATAGYASKLGVEIKSLKGMFDAFSNFEDAAAGAAKLGEAFGMNVDAMAMMNAESPAEQMDQMRNAFMETGKSVDDLNRHQRAYLAETMKVNPDDLQAMFDPNNADISYDDMISAAEEAEKEMSPADAMKEAAKEITKAFKQMEMKSNTFFSAFKEGFLTGLKYTKPYREFFKALHSALREVFAIGKDLAKQLFGSGGVFSKDAMGFVGKWKAYLKEIVGWFKKLSGFIVDFAKDLKGGGDPSVAIQTFLDKIFKSAEDFFSSDAVVEWNLMLAGFMKVAAKLFEKMATGLIHWVAKKIKGIALSWSDDTGVMSAWGEAFMALWDALKTVAVELWKVLGPPILEGLNKVWEWLKPHLFTALKWMFIIAITKALISAAAVALAGAVLKGILAPMLGAVKKATKSLGPPVKQTGPVESMMDTAKALERPINWPLAMLNAAALTAFIIGAFLGTLAAFLLLYNVLKSLSPKMALVTAAVMAAMAFAFNGMAQAVVALSKLLPPQIIAATISGVLVIALMLVLGLVGMAIIKMIKMSMPMPPIDQIGLFFLTMGATMLAAAIALKLAQGASKFAKPQVALGLVVLAATMIALGGVAWVIAKMFSSINPSTLKQVAPIMVALSLLMGVVMLALPIAGLLGVMLMAWPFGTAGVAIIAAGFLVLGGLASTMVLGLMPALRMIAGIKIVDPASVKQITEALAAIIIAMSHFMASVADTMNAAKPTEGSSDTMEGNLKAMEGVIGAVLNPMMKIITILVDMVANAKIKPENLQALQAIGKIMGSVAQLAQAVTPSPEHVKMIKASGDWWGSKRKRAVLDKMNQAMAHQRRFIIRLLVVVGAVISKMLEAAKGITSPEAAKALDAVAGILKIVVDIMEKMKPSKDQIKAIKRAARGKSGYKVMSMMNTQMKTMAAVISPIIRALGDATVVIMNALVPVIQMIGTLKVDPKALEAVAKIMAAVMQGVTGLASGIGPAMTAMQQSAKASSSGGGWSLWGGKKGTDEADKMSGLMKDMGTMVKAMGEGMETMIGSIKTLIILIMQQAKGIKNPKAMAKRMDVVVKAVGVVATVMKPLQMVMDLMSKNMGKKKSFFSMRRIARFLFGKGNKPGLLVEVIRESGYGMRILMWNVLAATKGIKDPKMLEKKMKLITVGFEIVGKMIGVLAKVMKLFDPKWSWATWYHMVTFLFGTETKGGLMTDIIKEAGYGMRILMRNVISATKDIKNPKAMKARLEIVTMAIEVVGKMCDALAKVMGIFKPEWSWETWDKLVTFLFGTRTTGGLMTKIIAEAGYGMRILMLNVLSATKGIKNPKALKARMELIVMAMDIVGSMIGTLKEVMSMFDPNASWDTWREMVKFLFGTETEGGVMTDIIKEAGYGIRILMRNVQEATKDIKNPKAMKSRLKLVGQAFEAMGDLSVAINSLKGTGDMSSALTDVQGLNKIFADGDTMDKLKQSLSNITSFTYARSPKAALPDMVAVTNLIIQGAIPLFSALRLWSTSPGNADDMKSMNDIISGSGTGVSLQTLMDTVSGLIYPKDLDPMPYLKFHAFIAQVLIPLFTTIASASGGGWFKPKTNESIGALHYLIVGSEKWYGLVELMDTVASIRKTPPMGKAAKKLSQFGMLMGRILLPLFNVMNAVVDTAPAPFEMMMLGFKLESMFEAISDGLDFKMQPSQLDAAARILGQFADRFMFIALSLDRVRYALRRTVKFASMKITPEVVVQKAAEKIDELSSAFATLDELVVDSTMAKVAEGLQGVGELKVNHKGLAINLSVTVTIDSKDLASSMNPADGAYFVINEERGVPVSSSEFNS